MAPHYDGFEGFLSLGGIFDSMAWRFLINFFDDQGKKQNPPEVISKSLPYWSQQRNIPLSGRLKNQSSGEAYQQPVWKVPLSGVIKFNCDTSYREELIARDDKGVWNEGFYFSRPMCSALAGEAFL